MQTAPSISLAEYHALVKGGAVSCVRARRESPEEQLQRACFEWVVLHEARHPILRRMIHVPNGGKRPRGEAGKMKGLGVRKGVPDFLLPFAHNNYAGLAIELKAGNNGLTSEQEDWLAAADKNGQIAAVCRTLEEFVEVVQTFVGRSSGIKKD